jgi:hypothetical protein
VRIGHSSDIMASVTCRALLSQLQCCASVTCKAQLESKEQHLTAAMFSTALQNQAANQHLPQCQTSCVVYMRPLHINLTQLI